MAFCSTSLNGKIIIWSPKRAFKEVCWRPSASSVAKKVPSEVRTDLTAFSHLLHVHNSDFSWFISIRLLTFPMGEYKREDNWDAIPQFPHKKQSPGKQWAGPALTAVGFGTDFDLAKLLSWGSTGEELKTQDQQRRKVSGTQTGLTPAQEKQCQGLEKNSFFLSFPGSGHQASSHGTGGRLLP